MAKVSLRDLQSAEAQYDVAIARSDIEIARDEVKAIAATANLSADFETAAADERANADRFRIGAIGVALFAIVTSIAVYLIDKDASWQNHAIKGVLFWPLYGIAIYLSIEARDHRLYARRAREWQVRLNTVRSYTDELPLEERVRIRTEFGLVVFKEPAPLEPGESMGDAIGYLRQLADILRKPVDPRRLD